MLSVRQRFIPIEDVRNQTDGRAKEWLLSNHHPWGTLSGLLFGGAIAFLISGGITTWLLIVLFFLGLGYSSRGVCHIVLSLMLGISATGIFSIAYGSLPRISPMPLVVLVVACGIFILLASRLARELFEVANSQARVTELSVLGVSFALIQRWPMRTSTDYLSFLSYEDNAAWVQTAAGFRDGHYKTGAGGFVLDPLMGILHWLLSLGQGQFSQLPSTAYVVTGTTYKVIEFLGILAAGLLVLRLSQSSGRRSPVPIVLAPASTALTYAALQLPQSTGHLTFIGALLFRWSMGLVGSQLIEPTTKHSRTVVAVFSLLLVGMTGMWWPLLLILPFALAVSLTLHIPTTKIESFVGRWRKITPTSLVATAIGGALFIILTVPITRNFRSISVRDFFYVKGGLHVATSSLLVTSALSLFFLAVLLNVSNERGRISRSSGVFISTLVMIAILAIVMYFSSLFVGPDYTQNYSVQKITLLFALSCVPLIAVAMNAVAQLPSLNSASLSVIPLFFFIGTLSIGWNINTPRQLVQPSWAESLLQTADASPNAVILCSTSDPNRNMDSYLCSRHAAALQPIIGPLSTEWRHVQLFPNHLTSEDDERIGRITSHLSNLLMAKKQIILLALEEDAGIAAEDQWWMSRLPLDEFKLVGTVS